MERPKELPTGIGEIFHEERNKTRLPALEVVNTVLWINPAFPELPFRLEEELPTDLGIFFTPKPPIPPPELSKWKKFLGHKQQPKGEKVHSPSVMPEVEARSGLLGSVLFRDQEGRIYRDIDVKGIGLFTFTYGGEKVRQVHPKTEFGGNKEAWGLHDYHFASRDRKYSEEFLKTDIRTYRIVAIIDLKEIIDGDGKKISIAEAKEKGMLPSDMEPVIEVRAFGSRERVEYLGPYGSRATLALEDAKNLVAQEQGLRSEDFSHEDYLLWFAKNLGRNIAKIRKLGLYHSYLSEHNITLDCRIVDLDSVATLDEWRKDERYSKSSWGDEKFYADDFLRARSTLATLVQSVVKMIQIPEGNAPWLKAETSKVYEGSYKEELSIPRQEDL